MIEYGYNPQGRGFLFKRRYNKLMKRFLTPLVLGVLLIRPVPIDHAQTISQTSAATATTASSTVTISTQPRLTALQEIEVWVTAYASVPQETDDTPFITASNKHVADGFIAANFLPFGTKVQIPSLFGDKIFTVEDRMDRRMVDYVDIWMPTISEAENFGIHKARIIVLGAPGEHLAEN
jgi:3D (Asp-Asp-Asp) domain-containing protein